MHTAHGWPHNNKPLLACIACAVTLALLYFSHSGHPRTAGSKWVVFRSQTGDQQEEPMLMHAPAIHKPVDLEPVYEVLNGSEVVWQIPPTPRGVLLVAHGCHHGAVDWWPKHPRCEWCIGLAEEVNITREALSRGYAVLALSSADREDSRCWQSSSPVLGEWDSQDMVQARAVLESWLPAHGLERAPVYALGASSGGDFVLHLGMGNGIILAGVCSQIMGVQADNLNKYFAELKAQKGKSLKPADRLTAYPPTMFVHMPRDKFTAASVAEDIAALKSEAVPVMEMQIHPSPLTPNRLHEAAPNEITQEQSQAIYTVFKDKQMINDAGLLTVNPRATDWRKALTDAQVPGVEKLRLQPDESPISEVLNVLFAGHEIVSSTTTDMLDWFESLPYPARSLA